MFGFCCCERLSILLHPVLPTGGLTEALERDILW
jgi:hypothetical protein